MTKNYPTVLLIAPTIRGGKDLEEFLESVQNLNYPLQKLTTIVIDNSSGQVTKIFNKKYPFTTYIKSKNLSFAKSVNLAINKKKADYIFIANDDLVLTPSSINKMVSKMEKDQTIGALGGKILFKDKPSTIASHGHTFNFWFGLVRDDPRSPDIEKEPLWLDGCALMISKKIIEQLNQMERMRNKFSRVTRPGFSLARSSSNEISQSKPSVTEKISVPDSFELLDENYPMYFEDADLCIRIKKAGFRVVYDPKIIFFHGQSHSYSILPSWKKFFYWYRSKMRFMIKSYINIHQ